MIQSPTGWHRIQRVTIKLTINLVTSQKLSNPNFLNRQVQPDLTHLTLREAVKGTALLTFPSGFLGSSGTYSEGARQ